MTKKVIGKTLAAKTACELIFESFANQLATAERACLLLDSLNATLREHQLDHSVQLVTNEFGGVSAIAVCPQGKTSFLIQYPPNQKQTDHAKTH